MSAAEMREAAALAAHDALFNLCLGTHGGDLSDVTCADVSNAATSAIRALPLPDEEGMLERVARALLVSEREAYANSPELLDEHFEWWRAGRDNPESCVHYSSIGLAVRHAHAAIRSINGGEP